MCMEEKSEYDFKKAKEEYIQFCENTDNDIQIFAKPWYLDAVCDDGETWQVVIYKEKGQIRAAFPFIYLSGKYGIKHICAPWQAKRLGIWIDYTGKSKKRGKIEAYENQIVEYIISQLPSFNSFDMPFDARFKNWQVFYRENFLQTTYYSYLIKKEENLDELISSGLKNKLRKAQNELTIEEKIELEDYLKFFLWSYELRGKTLSYSEEKIRKLITEAVKHDSCYLLAAKDKFLKIRGVACVFTDSRRAYKMFDTYDPQVNSKAQILLTFSSVQKAREMKLDFDFEGSMIQGVAEYNREFGGFKEEYYYIYRKDVKMKLLEILSELKNTKKHSN